TAEPDRRSAPSAATRGTSARRATRGGPRERQALRVHLQPLPDRRLPLPPRPAEAEGGAVPLDDLTRDLFRMPDEPPSGVVETCPECMTRGQQPVAWHRPDVETLTCAYTCSN